VILERSCSAIKWYPIIISGLDSRMQNWSKLQSSYPVLHRFALKSRLSVQLWTNLCLHFAVVMCLAQRSVAASHWQKWLRSLCSTVPSENETCPCPATRCDSSLSSSPGAAYMAPWNFRGFRRLCNEATFVSAFLCQRLSEGYEMTSTKNHNLGSQYRYIHVYTCIYLSIHRVQARVCFQTKQASRFLPLNHW